MLSILAAPLLTCECYPLFSWVGSSLAMLEHIRLELARNGVWDRIYLSLYLKMFIFCPIIDCLTKNRNSRLQNSKHVTLESSSVEASAFVIFVLSYVTLFFFHRHSGSFVCFILFFSILKFNDDVPSCTSFFIHCADDQWALQTRDSCPSVLENYYFLDDFSMFSVHFF